MLRFEEGGERGEEETGGGRGAYIHHALADYGLGEDGERWRCLVGVDYGFCRHGLMLGCVCF